MSSKTLAKQEPPKRANLRCAIYTRKSTEEGLEQEFNSLDAQREACEAYISSQREAGWVALSDRYDDGGFTGANMDRPALTRLLSDIEKGRVDVIVVYKVDRLSRSLLDFARIIEVFEKRNISFVSVTQQFNTSTSVGRLVQNILLSFAQFEREMIAERTRDKMRAARRKGKWIGGRPPLGYDVDASSRSGRLVINQEEAGQVRAIFSLYLEERSLLRVAECVNARGWRLKSWTTKKGERHGGGLWEKNTIRRILTCPIYIGKVECAGELYPGEHPPLIEDAVFQSVAEEMNSQRHTKTAVRPNKHGFLLRGLVRCTACQSAMTSTTSAPRGTPYRYYACISVIKRGKEECPVRAVPAEALEQLVVEHIQEMGQNPNMLKRVIDEISKAKQRDVPELTVEQRHLNAEQITLRNEAKQLLQALGEQKVGDGRFVTERLSVLDKRAEQVEQRLSEIHEALERIIHSVVKKEDVEEAFRLFVPAWEHLNSRERARVIHLLIETIEFDGRSGKVHLSMRRAGTEALALEEQRGEIFLRRAS